MSSTVLERNHPVTPSLLQSFGAALCRCAQALRQHGEKRRAAQHLMSSSDHLLRDIGIDRRQIMAAVNGRLPAERYHDAAR